MTNRIADTFWTVGCNKIMVENHKLLQQAFDAVVKISPGRLALSHMDVNSSPYCFIFFLYFFNLEAKFTERRRDTHTQIGLPSAASLPKC